MPSPDNKKRDRAAYMREYNSRPDVKERVSRRRRELYANNRDKVIRRVRAYDLKRRYGVTPEEIDHQAQLQGNKCLLCKEGFQETPCVDHDHQTGKARGLLCRSCNCGLGYFKDDIEILKNAIHYLVAHKGT